MPVLGTFMTGWLYRLRDNTSICICDFEAHSFLSGKIVKFIFGSTQWSAGVGTHWLNVQSCDLAVSEEKSKKSTNCRRLFSSVLLYSPLTRLSETTVDVLTTKFARELSSLLWIYWALPLLLSGGKNRIEEKVQVHIYYTFSTQAKRVGPSLLLLLV